MHSGHTNVEHISKGFLNNSGAHEVDTEPWVLAPSQGVQTGLLARKPQDTRHSNHTTPELSPNYYPGVK